MFPIFEKKLPGVAVPQVRSGKKDEPVTLIYSHRVHDAGRTISFSNPSFNKALGVRLLDALFLLAKTSWNDWREDPDELVNITRPRIYLHVSDRRLSAFRLFIIILTTYTSGLGIGSLGSQNLLSIRVLGPHEDSPKRSPKPFSNSSVWVSSSISAINLL